MELYEANRILRSVKCAMAADGRKLPQSVDTDGIMILLGKLDRDKFLTPKIKHARGSGRSPVTIERDADQITFFRALSAVTQPLSEPVAAMSLLLLHKTLYGDTYASAGKLRTVNLATEGNAHTDKKYVPGALRSIAQKMNDIPKAPVTSKDEFASYLSHYMRELTILRPFEHGSEFAVRMFIFMFCEQKGFSLSFNRVSPSAILAAERAALADDDATALYKLFCECLSYDHNTDDGHPTPKTRREITREAYRPQRKPPTQAERRDRQKPIAKSDKNSDEVLKRAIKLQQKISRLNEQLIELMRPLENRDDK